jgi:hypothetical protein
MHITSKVRANKNNFVGRKAFASSRINEKHSYYDVIVAGGGMVGTTLACALG